MIFGLEIQNIEKFENDNDLMSAIVENYGVIKRYLSIQIQILERIAAADKFSFFLSENKIEDLKEELKKYELKSKEFDSILNNEEGIFL